MNSLRDLTYDELTAEVIRQVAINNALLDELAEHQVCQHTRNCLICKDRIAPNYGVCFGCTTALRL